MPRFQEFTQYTVGGRQLTPTHNTSFQSLMILTLAGHSHQVVFWRASATTHQKPILAIQSLIKWGRTDVVWRSAGDGGLRFIQNTYGTILPDPIGDLVGVNPEGQLPRQKREQLFTRYSDPICSFRNDGVHFVVNADATITRSLLWSVGEPMVLVVFCQSFLETIPENRKLMLAEIAPCSQQSGNKVRRGRYFGTHFKFGSVAVVHFLHNIFKGILCK